MSGGHTSGRATAQAAAKSHQKTFRRDIQGLRAFGLAIVFLCHAEFPIAEGGFVGLDLFFVISGFLITGLIVTEMERTGTVSLVKFYARRIRRLLPLAITVLIAVLIGSALLFSPVRNDAVAADVVAASLYVVNWRFAEQAVDYFAVEPLDSPLQHFWSLSVEEQFYLLWPALLLVALVWWKRDEDRRLRPALWVVVLAAGVPSLLYSGWLVDGAGSYSYFSTLTRVWEFALGAALALALPARTNIPRPAVHLLGWAGIGVLCLTTLTFTQQMRYPGTAALLPTLATAAIVVAGTTSMTIGPLRLLSSRPFQYVGDLSYAWYLWHWPAIVFARAEWGPLSQWETLAVIGASFVPTALSHRFIEQPFRYAGPLRAHPRRALAFGASCMGGAVLAAMTLTSLQPSMVTAAVSEVDGALAGQRGTALQRSAVALRPTPREARDDRGQLYRDGCLVPQQEIESPECVYGDSSSETTVVLFGNSHAMHYFPALEQLAHERSWRLVALTRAGCPIGDVRFAYRCDTWREKTLQRIETRERPAMVVAGTSTSGGLGVVQDGDRLGTDESRPLLETGYARTLERLRATGAEVVVLKDLPRAPEDVPNCVSREVDHLERCAFPHRRKQMADYDARAAAQVKGARAVDPASVVCPRGVCPAVMGNALVYRDDNHFTATFARTLAPWLGRQLPILH